MHAEIIIILSHLFIYLYFLYYVICCHINNTLYSDIWKLIVYTIYVLLFVSEGLGCWQVFRTHLRKKNLKWCRIFFFFNANPIFMLGKNTLVYQNRMQIIRNKLSATYFYRIKLIKAFHMWMQIKYLNRWLSLIFTTGNNFMTSPFIPNRILA